MTTLPPPEDLAYLYHGFHSALRRFRSVTIIGWIIVLIGIAGFPLGWRSGAVHGLIDLLLCAATIVAGLALVSEAVSFLNAYVALPFRSSLPPEEAGGGDSFAEQVHRLMEDVAAGGWQEAYAAIRTLEEIGERHGLPPAG